VGVYSLTDAKNETEAAIEERDEFVEYHHQASSRERERAHACILSSEQESEWLWV
jgi:hypothetical protein